MHQVRVRLRKDAVSGAVTCSDGEEGLVDLVNADIIDLIETNNEAIAADERQHAHQSPGQQRPVYTLHGHTGPQQQTFEQQQNLLLATASGVFDKSVVRPIACKVSAICSTGSNIDPDPTSPDSPPNACCPWRGFCKQANHSIAPVHTHLPGSTPIISTCTDAYHPCILLPLTCTAPLMVLIYYMNYA